KTNALLQEALMKDTSSSWIARLNAAGVPAGPVYTMDAVFADPQVKHLGLAWTVPHPKLGAIDLVRPPMRLSGVEPPRRPTPERGEHTEEVLAEFGVTPEQVAELREAGAI
ncbi:MAG TPA: CoA transferase, partial [Crenalkalicoccus sp.]|nr:CoA transferase [Crenalkalicoccus sp.]